MKKSTHKAEVVPFSMVKHPDADSLSIVQVWDYQVCVRTQDWEGVEKAVYIVPDSVVYVSRPEFAFLSADAKTDGSYRVKAKRLRGVVSKGMMVPAPPGSQIGDDVAEMLGVERYEPPEPSDGARDKFVIGGEEEDGPDIDTGPSHYDVEAFERYARGVFVDGEPVVVTEKADGSNVRFVFHDGRFWVKSRNRWVKRIPSYNHITLDSLTAKGMPEDKAAAVIAGLAKKICSVNGFWQALEKTKNLAEFLKANPGVTVYGEVHGSTNRIRYGFPDGNRFASFDVYANGKFLDFAEAYSMTSHLPWVPIYNMVEDGVVEPILFDVGKMMEMCEGKTLAADAKASVIREGVVVRPFVERWNRATGRVHLKLINPDFHAIKG